MEPGMSKRPVCLTIGGSDSCGGAGIQADLRVFEALNVQGCSAVTALTAQNPDSISRMEAVSLAQLDAELHAVFDYYDIAVVKTGMLIDAGHVAVISALLQQLHHGHLVIDPVMLSSSGIRLLHGGAVDSVILSLFPMATLVTPNLDEIAVLLGEPVSDPVRAAKSLADQCGCAVLLKGGHADTDTLMDVLCDRDGKTSEFIHVRQQWSPDQRHGTGCRLASAISANLAHRLPLHQAVEKSIARLQANDI
jgi:hydroxymethylpyrimidine/phosphomethylpyrimidine kinase